MDAEERSLGAILVKEGFGGGHCYSSTKRIVSSVDYYPIELWGMRPIFGPAIDE